MLTSGQLLADRYRLARRIAVGGMGEVWEAADTRLDRRVAIKVLKPELTGDAEFLHRFRTEARMTASLNHPNIAAVHDYGETAAVPDGPQDTAYLVMELVEGDPLAAIIAGQGRLNAERTMDVLEQAGHALQAAHERGLVHRDVKPGNILVTPHGKVKLTDFGIAKAAHAAPVTRSGMVMGTAHYIAPEQALGSEAEPASDVYSLAVVGYECLAGHRPFLSDNSVTVAMMHIRDLAPPLPPDVPPGPRALIEATLIKDPRQRYRSGGEFAVAVAAVRAGRPLPVPSGLSMPQAPVGVPLGPPQLGPGGPITPMSAPGIPVLGHGTGQFTPVGMTRHPGPARTRRTGLWLVIAVFAVAALVLAAWVISEFMRTASQGSVQVNPAEYVGRAASEAADRLTKSGLHSEVWTKDGQRPADPARCVVTEVTPVGQLSAGSDVTLRCTPHEDG
ncbi:MULTISPECIES: serine/threonine-protein kinase [unclassified Crossiella]|uniref:serine/threonine-protein kinase n=1 Tax=unclassified Crossiella TaxID=2620835 RepID=UPI001FFFBFFD|nr:MULTISPECIES: serine/threonine-protein kinase [unclassified Crossiella]MCK2245138.1 serine/threonine protein kinase [Crossiella sp. S99.2]MCK2258791.1 serine/threonine protein kinase [Crossiella sp. S99.1]